jgi:hypothetical protein
MHMNSSARVRTLRIALLVLALVALLGVTACKGKDASLRDVADKSGLLHFKIPSDWQYLVGDGMISVYADEELPGEGEAADSLSIVVYVSRTATETPVADTLLAYVDYWSEGRGWSGVSVTDPEQTVVGGRDGLRVGIEGTDGSGRAFRATYVWVRTAGQEVLITAFAPPEDWDDHSAALDDVLAEWYWHRADDAAAVDSTATP